LYTVLLTKVSDFTISSLYSQTLYIYLQGHFVQYKAPTSYIYLHICQIINIMP